jgi:hypothetical protein
LWLSSGFDCVISSRAYLKVLELGADNVSVKKFFDKEIAAEAGYLTALEIAAASAQLHADLVAMAALRKARDRPLLKEEEADDIAFFRELIAKGFPLEPEVVAWALED